MIRKKRPAGLGRGPARAFLWRGPIKRRHTASPLTAPLRENETPFPPDPVPPEAPPTWLSAIFRESALHAHGNVGVPHVFNLPAPPPPATHTKNKVSFASSTKPRVATAFPNLGTQTSVISGALRGPGARRALKARPIFTEASAKQCPLLRAQERVGGHGGWGGSGPTSRHDPRPGRGSQSPQRGTAPLGLRASRHGGGRAAVGDVPSALPEPVSTAVAWTGAAKTGPPEPSSRGLERPDHRARSSEDWRRLRHARGGAAAGGGRSRKRKRRSERGVGPSRSRILGDDASL